MDTSSAFALPAGLGAAFLAVALATLVLADTLLGRREIRRTLQSVRETHPPRFRRPPAELSEPFTRRVLIPGLEGLAKLVLRFTPGAVVDRLDRELVHAGSPANWEGARLLATMAASAVIFFVGAVAVLPVVGFGFLRTLILAPFVGAFGYYLPEWAVGARAGRRQQAIRRALPDALDLMSITVEAGLGFDAALERVSREMGGPLGEELHRVLQEMRLGKGRGEALRDLGERTPVDELRSFVLAMVQAEIFGISVSRVLHVQADESRIRRRQVAEERAQKLPVKIVFPLVLCIFPALFLILLGPAAISIYDNILNP